MVKAEPRPMSSLMLQLLSGSHIPATEAKPEHTHTHQANTQTQGQDTAFLGVPLIKLGINTYLPLFTTGWGDWARNHILFLLKKKKTALAAGKCLDECGLDLHVPVRVTRYPLNSGQGGET